MNAIYILFAGEIILLIIAYFLVGRDLFAPSVFMCIMFCISTIFAVLNVNNWAYGEGYNIDACILILGGITVFIIAETLVQIILKNVKLSLYIKSAKKKKNSVEIIDIKTVIVILIVLIDLIIIILYFNEIARIAGGFSQDMFARYRRLGIYKMAGGEVGSINSIVNQMSNFPVASGYVAGYIFVNNLITRDDRKFRQLLLCFATIMGITPSFMTAGRTQILMYFSAFLIYYYIIWNQKYDWRKNISVKFIKIGMISVAIGIPAFYYSLKLLGRETKLKLFDYVSDYLGSSIFLFGKYVESPIPKKIWGEETLYNFRKIIAFLGFGEKSTSYNLEFRSTGIAESNIYTFFRRPLHDYGTVGMFIFTACVAIFFAWMYWGHIKVIKNTEKVRYWVLMYGYFFYWIFCSSMLQYSQMYISVGAMNKVIIILVVFKVIRSFRFKGVRYIIRM